MCQGYAVLITAALYYNLKSESMVSSFFFLQDFIGNLVFFVV